MTIKDHPLRLKLVNELHARPFPVIEPPARAAFLALKAAKDSDSHDHDAHLAHLKALLDHFSAPPPEDGATHYSGRLGKYDLKWERHTEFVTYTLFGHGTAESPFNAKTFSHFPKGWLASSPGVRITSALIRIERQNDDNGIKAKLDEWFVHESLAVSRVLNESAVIGSDFRLDAVGQMRFAVFIAPGTGPQRTGRIVQRLCEIETYKSMSMLGLMRVRELDPEIGRIDSALTNLIVGMTKEVSQPAQALENLLRLSAELESILAQSSFRFGATVAYEALVNQRTLILQEEPFLGRQTFAEFMMRRFDPAMRTVRSTELRLRALADRASRAGELLRTRVEVERSTQNKDLLQSMDRRADQQLKLQRTVEGFSVAAISYYAVNLISYASAPAIARFEISKSYWLSGLTPVVIVLVFFLVRLLRDRLKQD